MRSPVGTVKAKLQAKAKDEFKKDKQAAKKAEIQRLKEERNAAITEKRTAYQSSGPAPKEAEAIKKAKEEYIQSTSKETLAKKQQAAKEALNKAKTEYTAARDTRKSSVAAAKDEFKKDKQAAKESYLTAKKEAAKFIKNKKTNNG
jgi:hypothetical protein